MKILQISTRIPYPPTSGGDIVTYNTLKHLALRGHDITLVSFVSEVKGALELEKYCRWAPVQKDTRTSITRLLLNLFSKTPYTISKYHANQAKEQVHKLLREDDIDIVHIEHLHVAYYGILIKKEFGLPIVLREHNVETIIMERFYENQKNPLIKAYAYLQYKKLWDYEAKICGMFDKCFMITEDDEKWIKEMNPRVKTSVIPSGVDTSYFNSLEAEEEPYSIIYVASMDWLPNVESILWFYKDIFPLIKKEVPEAKLYIVGRKPPVNIKILANKDIIVTGFVEDVREYIARSAVFIVPLKIGGGMRIKILNALAMGKAIVSTSIGCEGIDVTDGKDIYIADTEAQFARRVLELMGNKNKRRRLGEEGLRLVKEKYQWKRIAEQIEEEYKKILEA